MLRDAVRIGDLRGRPQDEKARLLLDQEGRWVALLRDDGAFGRLLGLAPATDQAVRRGVGI